MFRVLWNRKIKQRVVCTLLIFLTFVCLTAGIAVIIARERQDPLRELIVFQAEILENNNSTLIVFREGNECKEQISIRVGEHTVIMDALGKRVSAKQLLPGRKIEITASSIVIYEPITTYTNCRKILILR